MIVAMTCPWCPLKAQPRALHAHLSEVHADEVRFVERQGARYYAIECPVCHAAYEHQVNPHLRDPGFLEEFRREIRMVAFDMLVNHLLAEHGDLIDEGAQ